MRCHASATGAVVWTRASSVAVVNVTITSIAVLSLCTCVCAHEGASSFCVSGVVNVAIMCVSALASRVERGASAAVAAHVPHQRVCLELGGSCLEAVVALRVSAVPDAGLGATLCALCVANTMNVHGQPSACALLLCLGPRVPLDDVPRMPCRQQSHRRVTPRTHPRALRVGPP